MEEIPSLNMPVQRLKVAILPLDLPCSGPVTYSGEILTTDKSHGKKHVFYILLKLLSGSCSDRTIPKKGNGSLSFQNKRNLNSVLCFPRSRGRNTGSSKKMDGIWNRYNLKRTRRIYTFGILKCSDKFKVLDLP